MADHEKGVSRAAETEERAAAKGTTQPSGAIAAGSADNPQDGRDSGQSGEARPRGKTEDPDRTL